MNAQTAFAPPDGSAMRRAMGRFLTGVAVVTARAGDEHVGMTINSLTSISLDPPMLMISLNPGTRTLDAVLGAGRFAISILGRKQEAVARQFARPGGMRFDDGDFEFTERGIPVIAGALAHAECVVERELEVGDHRVVFGTVVSTRHRDGAPLAFYSGGFGEYVDGGEPPVPWLF